MKVGRSFKRLLARANTRIVDIRTRFREKKELKQVGGQAQITKYTAGETSSLSPDIKRFLSPAELARIDLRKYRVDLIRNQLLRAQSEFYFLGFTDYGLEKLSFASGVHEKRVLEGKQKLTRLKKEIKTIVGAKGLAIVVDSEKFRGELRGAIVEEVDKWITNIFADEEYWQKINSPEMLNQFARALQLVDEFSHADARRLYSGLLKRNLNVRIPSLELKE